MALSWIVVLAPLLIGYVQSRPQITVPDPPVKVREDVAVGSVAFQIEATGTPPLVYTISGPDASYFKVDRNTGQVTVNMPIDREIGVDTVLQVIVLTVEVSNDISFDRKPFNIFVEDANDNKPLFVDAPYNENVHEDVPLDTSILKVTATDRDFTVAGSVSYTIEQVVPVDGLSLFSIGAGSGVVKVTGGLNYTSKSSFYRLEIKATDGGGILNGVHIFQQNTAVAFITVIDVPDQNPQFVRLPYEASVKEDAAPGQSVFQVEAIDPDTEVNDRMMYSIASANVQDLFNINSSTGDISVQNVIDRESLADVNYIVELRVVATESKVDVNGVYASSSATVRITIGDINDNKPMFYACSADPCDNTTVENSFSASIDEHSAASVSVVDLNMGVKDPDAPANAIIQLRLEGPGKDAFSVMPSSIVSSGIVQIVVANPRDVDYERNETMSVLVIAEDKSVSGDCCSTATVTIQINDINDNIPAFKNDTYSLTVEEHSPVGTIVETITATDPDTMDVGKITYKLVPESIHRYFTVDLKSGAVKVSGELDRETRASYSATLQAVDSARNVGSASLEFTLLDINDQRPEIARDSYIEFMKEGPDGKVEIQIQAHDDDEEQTDNSKIVYQILPSQFSQNFTIDSVTGLLVNNGPMDREAIDPDADGRIELNVTASDMGTPSLSSQVTVIITVEDINDNSPRFTKHDYTFSVNESERGAFVGSVTALDEDQTVVNNRISFRIIGNANFVVLSLLEADGWGYMGNISVDQDQELDYEKQKMFEFKVEASDLGQQRDTATVKVHVLDINDERPEFPTGAKATVSENSSPGTVVYTVVGKDVDSDHLLTYKALSWTCRCGGKMEECKEDWFTLLPSGNVTVSPKATIDYETCDQVIMEAEVVDVLTEKGFNNSLPGELIIDIEDVNDNTPQFIESSVLFVVVTESTEKGTSVASVTATDEDSGKNKEITFRVLEVKFIDENNVEIPMEGSFYVDTAAEGNEYVGTIRSIGSLNSDLKGKYLVTVEAADHGVKVQLKNTTQLEVYTIDKSYRVGLEFNKPVAEVNKNLKEIEAALMSATKATVHILDVVAQSPDERATEVTLLGAYFVYRNGTALNKETVEKILQEDLHYAQILKDFGLEGIVVGETVGEAVDPMYFALLGLVGGLLIVLVVMITSLVCTQRNYKRKLKAAKALNKAAIVTTETQQPSAVVPGTNQYTMQANPVLNLNIDMANDQDYDEEDSSGDRASLNSLDYNIDINVNEKDTMPMMMIEEEEEDEDREETWSNIVPLDAALAGRGGKKSPENHHSFVNPTLDTTDL